MERKTICGMWGIMMYSRYRFGSVCVNHSCIVVINVMMVVLVVVVLIIVNGGRFISRQFSFISLSYFGAYWPNNHYGFI